MLEDVRGSRDNTKLWKEPQSRNLISASFVIAFCRNLMRPKLKGALIAAAALQIINVGASHYSGRAIAEESIRQGGNYEGIQLDRRHFGYSDWTPRHITMERTNFRGASMVQAKFLRIDFTGSNFSDADLSHSSFEESNLTKTDLQNASLFSAELFSMKLVSANLANADLRDTDLRGADFRNASLRGSDLRGANMQHADLRNADLTHADLDYAQLSGVNLSGASGVRQRELNEACGDRETKLDGNFRIPMCSNVHWFEGIHRHPNPCNQSADAVPEGSDYKRKEPDYCF